MTRNLKYTVDFETLNLAPAIKAEVKAIGQKGMFENYLSSALDKKGGDRGVKPFEARILSRIQNKLDAAKADYVELEEAEFDLVKEAFRREDSQWPAMQVRALMQYLSNIEDCEKDGKGA